MEISSIHQSFPFSYRNLLYPGGRRKTLKKKIIIIKKNRKNLKKLEEKKRRIINTFMPAGYSKSIDLPSSSKRSFFVFCFFFNNAQMDGLRIHIRVDTRYHDRFNRSSTSVYLELTNILFFCKKKRRTPPFLPILFCFYVFLAHVHKIL